jgi:integrase/recombinase XerC
MSMSTLSTRATTSSELNEHHAVWTTANAKARMAKAIEDRDHDAIWSAILAMLAEGDHVSPNTVTTYRAGVLRYLTWADAAGVNILRPARGDGSRYRHDLMTQYPNPSTVNTRLAAAKLIARVFDWLDLEHGDAFKNVKSVRDRREADTIRDAYSHRQVAALLSAATDPTDRVMVLLGADAGLRASEMIALEWAHVRLPARANGAWDGPGDAVIHGKGGTVARVPLGYELMDALVALPHREGPILPATRTPSGLRYRLNRLAARCGRELFGIDRPRGHRERALGLHPLRSRFATDVVNAHDLKVGQSALRHASVNTTARYAKGSRATVAAFVCDLRRAS